MRASTSELLVVLLIVIIVFGPQQLPKLGEMLGKSLKNFKRGLEDDSTSDEDR